MKYCFLLFFLITTISFSQVRETRAVWLATNYRLDWPPTSFSPDEQKKSLIEIFNNLKEKNFNTVFFQVRFNGTVLFKSSFEPLSPYINGEVDGDVSYDPLQFAIEQAHKHGIEFHAWINTNLVFTGNENYIFTNPNHISQRKPEWIIEYKNSSEKSFWLDVGLPEVRTYLSDLISEMVENYDLDGINLDYIRYPGKNFDDDFSFQIHGKGLHRDEFRRKNINSLVKEIYEKVKSLRPEVKVGASPIGVYRKLKGMISWESYSDLYQDSYLWLKEKYVDYLSPQIYWSLNDNPKFDILAKDWVDNSNGRNIVLGIGAFKENVKSEMEDIISISRQLKASGVSFFRYENIKDYNFNSFSNKSLPAKMQWLEQSYPIKPINLSFKQNTDERLFTLFWDLDENNQDLDSVKYFSIYNLPNKSSQINSNYLFDVIPADKNYVTIAINKPKKTKYYFAIKSINKVWTESKESTNNVEIEIPKIKELLDAGFNIDKPILYKSKEHGNYIICESNNNDEMEIYGGIKNVYSLIQKEKTIRGKNFIRILDLKKNYESIKIHFINSKKEFELKSGLL